MALVPRWTLYLLWIFSKYYQFRTHDIIQIGKLVIFKRSHRLICIMGVARGAAAPPPENSRDYATIGIIDYSIGIIDFCHHLPPPQPKSKRYVCMYNTYPHRYINTLYSIERKVEKASFTLKWNRENYFWKLGKNKSRYQEFIIKVIGWRCWPLPIPSTPELRPLYNSPNLYLFSWIHSFFFSSFCLKYYHSLPSHLIIPPLTSSPSV